LRNVRPIGEDKLFELQRRRRLRKREVRVPQSTDFEARLVNRGNGSYKGYPLSADEWPREIEELYV
jgi:hypothetical protein